MLSGFFPFILNSLPATPTAIVRLSDIRYWHFFFLSLGMQSGKPVKKISPSVLSQSGKENKEAAKAAHLIYVNESGKGIVRIRKGKKFIYSRDNKQVKDKQTLDRILKLAIPPSWINVWICSSPNGHLQATGLDLKHRKQYRYHAEWNALRNETKFHRLLDFGKVLPQLRKRVKKDILSGELSQQKVLATAIDLMDKTYIRVGNNSYEKMNGSYGLTTLKDKHVIISKDNILFCFTGKKGIEHTIKLKDRRLAKIVKQCRDIPGKNLFQYYTETGDKKTIDSGMVNNYIKEATGEEFSAKDIRTWAGSLQAIEYLRAACDAKNKMKEDISVPAMLEEVSRKLGNTRTVCKKYYIHPVLITMAGNNELLPYLSAPGNKENKNLLTRGEHILMHILTKCS